MMLLIDELDRVKSTATMMIRDVNVPMGLENAHNTCYMNVLLQCLFHIDRFRKLILTIRVSDKESILYVIQKTFAMMAFSNSLSYYPSSLILSLGIDPHVQCDVHEFFDLFISTLKAVLSEYHEVGAIKEIDDLFSGERLLCRCCMSCHQVFYRSDVFSFLDCSVVNTPRLEDALQVQFTKERMSGSERYFCSSCNRKCDAEVLTRIRVLPPVLMVRLQRLQYDRGSGSQLKLTNGVQIPLTLDFSQFCNLDASVGVSEYELSSVIQHHGDRASRGHYTCHTRNHDRWFSINDANVEEIACPYIDVNEHPWRPCKQPNRSFSVEPVAYHEIGNGDDHHNDPQPTSSSTSSSSPMPPPPISTTTPSSSSSSSCLLGGTTRSRRMATHQATVQSAYMCL